MARTVCLVFLLSLVAVCTEGTSEAGPMSLQNPYRSFNLSGINYGSEQWERDHARSQLRSATPAPQPTIRVGHRRRRHR